LAGAVATHRPDVVLVPYPGHLVVRWVRAAFSGPVVLDLFLSAYDTVVLDRKMCKPGSAMAGLMRRTDQRACAAADRILVDTPANAVFSAELVGLPRDRFVAVPVSDPSETDPPEFGLPARGGVLELLFFGTGVPLHGLNHLLDAMERCEGVRLTLIGGSADDRARALRMDSRRVRVLDEFVAPEILRGHLAQSHLVAGVFGTSPKADRVIPFKVMQALAAGRPVLTARTRATSLVLREGVDAALVPPGDADALAAMLAEFVAHPERLADLATAARSAYDSHFSIDRTGRDLLDVVRECAGLSPRREEPTESASLVGMT
jgi:glycosyltransferase involved in cell wall biosynthesis